MSSLLTLNIFHTFNSSYIAEPRTPFSIHEYCLNLMKQINCKRDNRRQIITNDSILLSNNSTNTTNVMHKPCQTI